MAHASNSNVALTLSGATVDCLKKARFVTFSCPLRMRTTAVRAAHNIWKFSISWLIEDKFGVVGPAD